MLLNDIKYDFKVKLAENRTNAAETATKAGLIPQDVTKVMKSKLINERFLKLYDALGYDIKLEYVKRPEKPETSLSESSDIVIDYAGEVPVK